MLGMYYRTSLNFIYSSSIFTYYFQLSVEVMEDVPEDVQMTVLQQHQQLMNTQHLNGGEIIPIEDGEGTSYEVYDGHDLLEEAYEYADDDGNIVYLSTGVPNATKACRELRMRMLKERHIDLVVNKVAGQRHSHRKRPLTVYECEECGKILRYPSKIEEHRRSHTGDKPHECPQCGQKFSQKGALKCHMRLHTGIYFSCINAVSIMVVFSYLGERPFHCTWDCGKSFVSSSALRMHEKSHSGERPFACGVCGRLFTKRSHCQRHEITVHPSESARPPIPSGLAAAGKDEDTLRDVVNGVIEEVRIERSLRANAS
uniref:Zinc finger protein n=1 Tax=Heterorhabditis bacteriophora TaxID=37862 RepID=A0A1I7WP58_HETBA